MKNKKHLENKAEIPEKKTEGVAEAKSTVVVDELQKKMAELLNDLQRTRADFENYRKQIELQKENEKKMAQYATVYKILPLIDDFGRAIGTYKELEPLRKTLEKTMKDLGLARIPSESGVEFNPDLHEAVMVEEGGDGKEVISETLRPGYYYGNQVIRPAMVKVKK